MERQTQGKALPYRSIAVQALYRVWKRLAGIPVPCSVVSALFPVLARAQEDKIRTCSSLMIEWFNVRAMACFAGLLPANGRTERASPNIEDNIMKFIAFLLASGIAPFLLTGCQSVQTTNAGAVGVARSQYMFMGLSSAEIEQQYAKSYQELLIKAEEKKLLDYDSENAARVDNISERLIKQAPFFRADSAHWNWQIALIKDKTVNANCGPGGKIIVYSGLIEQLKLTDDELAAVIGHEIAHALREHSREAISKAYPVNMASQIGSMLGYGGAVQLANIGVGLLMTLPNSRQAENEADLIGLELAARAGYNPNAAVTLWQKMAAHSTSRPPEFISTHPSSDKRISNLQAAIPKVMPLYQQVGRRQ